MKLVKIFGLAMVAAIAAMAVVGASAASADTLCLSSPVAATCPAGKTAPVGTAITSELKEGKAVLKGALNVECSKSTVSGKVTENPAAKVKGKIEGLTFTECTSCTEITAKEFGAAGKWIVEIDFLSNSIPVSQQDSFQVIEPRVELQKCPLGIQCTASAALVTLDLHSEEEAKKQTVVANEEKLSLGICGEGTWTAKYKITAPLPSFVAP